MLQSFAATRNRVIVRIRSLKQKLFAEQEEYLCEGGIAFLRGIIVELSGVLCGFEDSVPNSADESRKQKMQIIGKKPLFEFIAIGLALASLQGVPMKAYADERLQAPSDMYLNQVVGVLRSHVLAMRMILDHDDLKYADNMVRHAEAFERAFGMVGPMEWHVAEAFNYSQKSDAAEKLSEQQFEELAENSRTAIGKIKRSDIRYMRDKNKKLMRDSIDNMIISCGACHSRFPEGTVPHVWKGIKE